MPETHTRAKGKFGEDEACEHLLSQGYYIISRNYQSRYGEIDIIAVDNDGTIVFIEVKASTSIHYGNPLAKVNGVKQKKIIQMARLYLAEHDKTQAPCRFDVISFFCGKVTHLKNAFLDSPR